MLIAIRSILKLQFIVILAAVQLQIVTCLPLLRYRNNKETGPNVLENCTAYLHVESMRGRAVYYGAYELEPLKFPKMVSLYEHHRPFLTDDILSESDTNTMKLSMSKLYCPYFTYNLKGHQGFVARKPPPARVNCVTEVKCPREGGSVMDTLKCPVRKLMFFLNPFWIQCS